MVVVVDAVVDVVVVVVVSKMVNDFFRDFSLIKLSLTKIKKNESFLYRHQYGRKCQMEIIDKVGN